MVKKKKKEDISGLSEETQMIGVSVLCQMQSVLKAVKFDTCFRKILCVSVHWTPTKCCWRMETEPPLEFLGLSHAQSSRNSPAGGVPWAAEHPKGPQPMGAHCILTQPQKMGMAISQMRRLRPTQGHMAVSGEP